MGKDPLDLHFQKMTEGEVDPLDAYFAEQVPSEGDAEPGFLKRAAGYLGPRLASAGRLADLLSNPAEMLAQPFVDPSGAAETALQGAGVLDTGILTPLAGIAGLPEAVIGQPVPLTSRVADWLERSAQGLETKAEKHALDAGMSEGDIAAAYDVGNFVGYVAPIVASVGAANLAFRAPIFSGLKNPMARNFASDFTAGLIYGGAMIPGDREERLGYMMNESAAFGVTSLILGPFAAMRAFRYKRLRETAMAEEVEDLVRRIELGEDVTISTPNQAKALIQLLNEETFISNSQGAQRLLETGAHDQALLIGVQELAATRGSAAILRNFSGDFSDAAQRLEKFREQFPGLKFDVVKREIAEEVPAYRLQRGPNSEEELFPTETQFYWSVLDDSGTEVATINSIRYDDNSVRILEIGGAKPGAIGTRNMRALIAGAVEEIEKETGQAVTRVTGIRETGTHPGVRVTPRDKIGSSEIGMKQRLRPEYDIYFGTKGLSSKQRAQLKAEGRFAGQVVQRGGVQMEYVGRSAKKKGFVQVRRADGKLLNVKESSIVDTPFIIEEQLRTPAMDALYQSFRDFAARGQADILAARGGLSERDIILGIQDGSIRLSDDARRAFDAGGAIVHPEQLGLTPDQMINSITFGADGQILGKLERGEDEIWRMMNPDGQVAQEYAAFPAELVQQMPILDVVNKITTAQEAMEAFLRNGFDEAAILQPMPVYNFEQIFDAWAARNNLTPDLADYATAKNYFAQQYRREMWASLPEEEQAIFRALQKEQEELLANREVSLEALAGSKGFHLARLEGGRVAIREINTGFSLPFGSEELARDALNQIVRNEADMMSSLPEFFHGLGAYREGRPFDDIWNIPDDVLNPAKLQNLPWTFFRNRRDYFIAIEEATGIPIWSQGYQRVLEGHDRQLAALDPWAKAIRETWKRVPSERRIEIAKLWSSLEGEGLDMAGAIRRFKQEGFNALEISAFTRSRAMFDSWFAMSGIDPNRYISTYYTRIQPYFAKHGRFDVREIKDLAANEFEFWAEMTRTGELSMIELDPEIVLHKYIRGLTFQQYVKEPWSRLAQLVGTKDGGIQPIKIRDLPLEKQREIMARAMDGTTPDSPVIPDEIRAVTAEFLNKLRGVSDISVANLNNFSQRLFHKLGVRVDERTGEELINNFMSVMYGSAMGLRPASVARNLQQNSWQLYTRIGNKQMGPGLERALTKEGYDEAFDEGVLRLAEAGVPLGDRIFESLMEMYPPAGFEGASSRVIASAMQRGMRIGRVSRKVTEKFMLPFSSSDQISRAWAYHAQKLHTDDWLTRFESGKVGWETFEEEGLPFFATPIKKAFREEYDRFGRERALRYIGRMGADEANFIYGVGTQPGWMQSVTGRMAGMFGQYPMWAIELYAHRVRNGTVKQRMKLYMRTAALLGAYGVVASETGSDVWSWLSPISPLTWGGGPAVQYGIDLAELMSAPMDRKAGAAKRLARDLGRLSLPGQGFYRDISRTLDQDSPDQALFSLMLGRPVDRGHFALDALYQTELAPPMIPADRLPPIEGVPDLPDPRSGGLNLGQGGGGALPSLRDSLSTTSSTRTGPSLSDLLGNM